MQNDKQTILVIDDDPDIGTMMKMMLEYKGYAAIVSERADDAMNTINSDKVDLIIMDMLLSGVNGVDVCNDLKKNERTINIPIVMISAHPSAKDMCISAGADDFIAKPFDMQDMLSKIGRLLPN